MIYSLCLLLILVGLYGVVASRQTVKIVISLLIMQHGVHLLLLLIGYRDGGMPPIMDYGETVTSFETPVGPMSELARSWLHRLPGPRRPSLPSPD